MADIKPVGQLKPVETGIKPVGQLRPIQTNTTPIGQLREGDPNTVLPKYRTSQDLSVDSAIDFIKQKGGRNGSTILDSELDVLRDVLKDPRATKEQREKAILTIQGYDTKHDDNNTMYYMKQEDNGVYVPQALAYGEKPPKGHKVESVWGNQKEAEDDSWWQDLSKSFANGVLGAAQGVIDLTQVGTTLATGEESKYLNKLSNTAEALKFKKDSDLNAPIFNTEGITQWSDLLDKDRFNLDAQSLWGSFNMAAESLIGFAGGAKGAVTAAKSGKGFVQGLKGAGKEFIDENGVLQNAINLSDNATKATIFAGSFANQVGDVYETAKDAGLKGRDAAGFATAVAAPMAALDAFWGLDGKVMSELFTNQKRNLLKNVVKSVEKDAAGNITDNGFKQLTKEMTVGYSELAKKGIKEVVKDALSEGTQEAAQDFTQKAGEQLWDKLSNEDKAKFGTDALNAKSFGDYINSFASATIPGAGMSIGTQILRNKHDEQSLNAYERVKQGPQAVKALKVDLDNALKNGDITQGEYEQANFKIDSYGKYHEETKNVDLKPEDERKAFELSFQIQGLKTEIPTNENEISKLDPIARAKVESKQKQAKELQSELNDIIRKGEIKGEPVVPKKEEEREIKEKEKEVKAAEKVKEETNANLQQKPSKKEKVSEENPDFPIEPKVKKQPEFTNDKRTYDEITPEEFNHSRMNARTVHRVLRKKLSETPNNEMNGQLFIHQYEYNGKKNRTIRVKLEDGKIIKLASTKIIDDSGLSGHLHTERFKGNITNEPVGVKVVELKPTQEGKPGKKVIKIYQKSDGKFLSWVKETNTGKGDALDKEGNALYTAEQLDELEDLKLQDEPPASPDQVEELRNTPITPIVPRKPQEKADDALNELVKEAKQNLENKQKQKENAKQKSATNGKKPISGNNEETDGESESDVKATKLKSNKSRIQRKVKHPERLKAMKLEVNNAKDIALMYFTEGNFIDRDSLKSFFKGSEKEAFARQNLTLKEKDGKKLAPTIDGLAHELWQENNEKFPNIEESEYKNAIEEALLENLSPIEMARSLNAAYGASKNTRLEELVMGVYEEPGVDSNVADSVIDFLEGKTDEELKELAEKDKWEEGTDIVVDKTEEEPFQKESTKLSDNIQKVVDKLQSALPKVKIVYDRNLKAAGKWSPSTNIITINPEYAGKDTAIHEAGHILIDAIGYNNKIIQAAIKQLKTTPLYAETKERYKELSEQELDKEVLAEAIGREGADIFDKVADRSKFKAYLDYIFDWLKQKLGLDKNVAKSLAKQIIGGIKTKELKGTETGKEQLQKEKKKNPIGPSPLSFSQYAAEHGFSYEAETNKMDIAKVALQEANDAEQEALVNGTKEEHDKAVEELKAAKKAYAIAGKRTFEYKQYKKDFNAIQEVLKQKDLSNYSTEELQDLIAKIHGFNDKAAKAVKEEAMLRLAYMARKTMQDIHSQRADYIESIANSKDITPLQKSLLHISHFTEHQPEMQKLSLEFGNAVMDKISDASTRKGVHEKLAQKVIAEENKKLGITGAAMTRFSSDSAKYFDWMADKDGNLLTVDEAKSQGLSEAKINYLKFTRETIADFKEDLAKDNYENVVMEAIKVDKGFMEAFKSEGIIEAMSYYLGGGAYNLGKVRIEHNGTIKSYAEIEKEIIANTNRKSITSVLSGLWELLKANVKARRQLKKGYNVDEAVNPLEVKGAAEYSLNNKGQLVSKFDKPRAKDRGYSKDFYRAMNQFIDESAHVKHMSKIVPLVESVEYLNKKGYMEKGIMPKKNVAKWIEDWKALHIFKEPHVNDPVLDASIKMMRKLVASTTMWFNLPANMINVAVGNYNNWRQENGKTLAKGNARLFGGKGERAAGGVVNKYALDIIKKYNIVNQDYDSQPTLRATNIFSKMATIGTQLGEYQIQGSLALGLMPDNVYNSFEYTKDKYGNDVLTVKEGVDESEIKKEILKVKNRVTDIQGKYPDEDRRNIMRGEIGKAVFQFKVWIPDWYRERFAPEYYNAFGQRKEGTLRALYKDGFKKIYEDLKKGNFKELSKNKAFMSNLKGLAVIGSLIALKYRDDDDEEVRGKMSTFDNLLGQILFIMDPEQDKYMVSNPVAALGKTKDFISAAEAIITLDEKAWEKTKRVLPANKLEKVYDLGKKVVE